MRSILVALMIGLAWFCFSAPRLAAQESKTEKQQIKARQKADMRAFKLKAKYQKQSMKGRDVPKSVRLQMKHQMQREKRELQARHKDELQDLKDRQQSLREVQPR